MQCGVDAACPTRQPALGCVACGVDAGVRSARLLSWQERLAALRDMLLWDHALWLGLCIYTTAQPHPVKVHYKLAHPATRRAKTLSKSCYNEASAALALDLLWMFLKAPGNVAQLSYQHVQQCAK